MTFLYFVGLVGAAMFAGLVNPPRPRYAPETSWAELRFVESLPIVGLLTIAAFVAILVSVLVGKVRACQADLRFWPVPCRILAILRSALPRTILAIGLLIVVGYLVTTLTASWRLGRIPHGSFWPAERVLFSLVWIWTTIWLAETVVRPVRTPLLAALIFFAVSLLIGFNTAMRPSGGFVAARSGVAVRSVTDLIFDLGYEAETTKFTNFEGIPRWATETTGTEHFVYHHAKGDSPIHDSLEAQERHYQFFKQVLGIEMPQQLHFVKYTERRGLGGGGYILSKWWFDPHEAIHNFLPCRNKFLHEGLADAFGTTFYQFWGDFFIPKAEMNVQRLYEATDRLLSVTEADRRVACSFVRWLFHRHGPEKLVTALREAYPGGSRTRDVIARVYGAPFGDLAAQWQRDQQWLSTQQPPKGFFLYPPWEREARAPVSVPSTEDP